MLAIILLLMHMVTVIEVTHGDLRQTSTTDIDRTAAATWSFMGVLLTISAGVAADSIPGLLADSAAMAVPLTFMGRWAFHQLRISKSLDVAALNGQVNELYRTAVLRVVMDPRASGLTTTEISTGIWLFSSAMYPCPCLPFSTSSSLLRNVLQRRLHSSRRTKW
jgi:hypothetical protein